MPKDMLLVFSVGLFSIINTHIENGNIYNGLARVANYDVARAIHKFYKKYPRQLVKMRE